MKLMSPHDKQQLIKFIEEMPTTTPCMACINYNAGWCNLCEEKIPDEVKDVGCEEWKFSVDSIPF